MELAVFITTFALAAYFLCEEVGLGISTIFDRLPKTVRENRSTLIWAAALLALPFALSRLTSEILKSSESRLPASTSSIENLVIGIITTSSAIFVGNSLLRRSQRRQDEEKAISHVIFSLMRIAGNLESIGTIIIDSSSGINQPRINKNASLRRGSLRIISGKCDEILEYARNSLTQASSIHTSPKWYSFATKIDRVKNRVSLMLNQGFSPDICNPDEGLSLEKAGRVYFQIVFPLEIEIYDLLVSSQKDINQEYWKELASVIRGRLEDGDKSDRNFKIEKFAQSFSSQSGIRNFSPDYIRSSLNDQRNAILRKLADSK
ncbi:hypothetical protein IQ265_13065 [Nodosilinea sp. LEGE 06152]|uniref:hypothetical protein n=1 Tax=Nodosilinea sp. LEGE 06152 TaxID=2777966 RepID=UPI0018811B77|nr:hypothetical protein [Nodosilinea sp. LEGE 06152]MBE9157746.1 hypothetical protein [Nodosilinea sp. LEGE 06152]